MPKQLPPHIANQFTLEVRDYLVIAGVVLLALVVILQIVILVLKLRSRPKQSELSPEAEDLARLAASQSGETHGVKPAEGERAEEKSRKQSGKAWQWASALATAVIEPFKKKPEEPIPEPPVILESAGTAGSDQMALIRARHSPGFMPARWLLADVLLRRPTLLSLDYSAGTVAVRYQADGVWHNGQKLQRHLAEPALQSLKVLCGLDPADRRGLQRGQFVALFNGTRYEATMACQGVAGGERVVMQFSGPTEAFQTLQDLGMSEEHRQTLDGILRRGSGLLLLSAPPSSGLRTTTEGVIHGIDRLLRDVVSLEQEESPYATVEAVEANVFRTSQGESAAAALEKLFRREPDIVILRELPDGGTVDLISRETARNARLVISTIRARDCVEALLRVLALRVDRGQFARMVTAVLNQRLVRKLCPVCKEPYTPSAEDFAKLGLAPGSARLLYKPPRKAENVCQECGGTGYRGRTALFEMLVADSAFRQSLAAAPRHELIREAARQAGMKTLREQGARMVVEGVTSLREIRRVMKLHDPAKSPAAM